MCDLLFLCLCVNFGLCVYVGVVFVVLFGVVVVCVFASMYCGLRVCLLSVLFMLWFLCVCCLGSVQCRCMYSRMCVSLCVCCVHVF